MNSQERQLCYPRGNFSVNTRPHKGAHCRSLDHTFVIAISIMVITINLAFALTLYVGFLNQLSQPLGPADIFSAGCHPSQTAHQLLFLILEISNQLHNNKFYLVAEAPCYIIKLITIAGCSKVQRGLYFPLEVPGFCTGIVCSEGSS